jgi:hypothetical protein
MPGKGISGQYGDARWAATSGGSYVSIAEINKWEFGSKSKLHGYVSNKTGRYTRTVAGPLNGSGTLTITHDPTASTTGVIESGTGDNGTLFLKLYIDATQFYLVPAVIGELKLTVDIQEGAVVGGTASFEADGQWTNPVNEGSMRGRDKPSGNLAEIGESGIFDFKAPRVIEHNPAAVAVREREAKLAVAQMEQTVDKLGKRARVMEPAEFAEFTQWLARRRAA